MCVIIEAAVSCGCAGVIMRITAKPNGTEARGWIDVCRSGAGGCRGVRLSHTHTHTHTHVALLHRIHCLCATFSLCSLTHTHTHTHGANAGGHQRGNMACVFARCRCRWGVGCGVWGTCSRGQTRKATLSHVFLFAYGARLLLHCLLHCV